MKILVTGGTGFVGSYVIKALLAQGQKVISFGKLNEINNWIMGNDFSKRDLIVINGDITNIDSVVKSISINLPDVVVHLAAVTGIKTCKDNPEKSFSANVYGTYNVVEACIQTDSRLIFSSSREVYGETIGNKTSEDAPKLPNNLYGVTKLLGESIIVNAQRKSNLRCTILRFTNVYGPSGDKYAIQLLIKKAIRGDKISILGGKQIMNFVHVDDVVNSILACINDSRSIGEIFNVGSYDSVSIDDLVYKIVQLVGKKNVIERKPLRETETLNFEPDLDKISVILGWSPQISLEDGLRSTINFYKNADERNL